MRHIYCLFASLLLITGSLSGCTLSNSNISPAFTETQNPSPTSVPPTLTLQAIQTATLMAPATLEPEQARETIRNLLQTSVDCSAPCFWGIIPEQTTLGESEEIFAHLGLSMKHTNTRDGKEFYEVKFNSESNLSISPLLTIETDTVKNMRILIYPETEKAGVQRQWLAYSPEILINRYGPPSKVDFSVGYPRDPGGGPDVWYSMTMYFNEVELIVSYEYGEIQPPAVSLKACPLTDQFTIVRIWLGQNPEHPPLEEIPLEKATTLTTEEFSKLMTRDPNNSCFSLKGEMFP